MKGTVQYSTSITVCTIYSTYCNTSTVLCEWYYNSGAILCIPLYTVECYHCCGYFEERMQPKLEYLTMRLKYSYFIFTGEIANS